MTSFLTLAQTCEFTLNKLYTLVHTFNTLKVVKSNLKVVPGVARETE